MLPVVSDPLYETFGPVDIKINIYVNIDVINKMFLFDIIKRKRFVDHTNGYI